MTDFVRDLLDPDFALLRYSLIAGLLGSVAFGIVGSYVVVRRISYIAGAISHSVLGGIGMAIYLRAAGWSWLDPMLGALAAALLSAVVIGLVSLYAREREDTIIGAVWAIGMAVGILFLYKTSGYQNAGDYLFGRILLIDQRDLWLLLGLDLVVIGLCTLLYHKFLAFCFDEQFTELRGVGVRTLYLLLLCLIALSIVLLVRLVGMVLLIALLTLPAAVAGRFARRLWQMMIWASLFCMTFVLTGIAGSYAYDLPSGPVIVVIAAAAYLAVSLLGGVGIKGSGFGMKGSGFRVQGSGKEAPEE